MILVNTRDLARFIMHYALQAQNHSYSYPQYAWILYDWYTDEWWTMGDPIRGCNNSDLEAFLERSITVQLPEFGNGNTTIGTVSRFRLKAGQPLSTLIQLFK